MHFFVTAGALLFTDTTEDILMTYTSVFFRNCGDLTNNFKSKVE